MLSPITKQGRYHKLMLTGLGDQEEDLLIAAKVKTVIQKDSSKREILTEVGSLGLVSYERISRKVILVPVNGAQCPQNAQYIKDELNRIYAPAIVSWSVKLAAPLRVDNLKANGFGSSEMNAFSRYTPNMRKLTRAFKKTGQKGKHTLVLFFIKDPSVDFTGFMPLSSDFGFIFNFGSESEVLAHELAHGAFQLATYFFY